MTERFYHANCALTHDQVREIRQSYDEGRRYPQRHPNHVTMLQLAKEYGVAKNTIWMAVTGQTYPHVSPTQGDR